MPDVWNRNKPFPRDAVYIGRPSKWENPYRIGVDGSRSVVIQKFRVHLYKSGLINDIHELRGCHLVCFCKPLACHGDILLDLANPFFEV